MNQAKSNGASDAELDAITQQIIEVEYKNNPLLMQRMLLLKQIEPYPHKTQDQMLSLYDKGLADKYKMLIKLNFSSYIDKFERENINIIAFGLNIPIKQKIEIIYNKLLEYATADDTTTSSQSTEGAIGSQEGRTTWIEEWW